MRRLFSGSLTKVAAAFFALVVGCSFCPQAQTLCYSSIEHRVLVCVWCGVWAGPNKYFCCASFRPQRLALSTMSSEQNPFSKEPQSVDTDFLSDLIGDDDDEYVTEAGAGQVITKTFKAPEDENMRDFMQKKDLVLVDLDIIVEKTNEVKRITHELEDVYVEEETKELQKELNENIKSGDYRSIRAKKKLNQLKKSTKELKKSQNKRLKSQLQIRRNIQQTLEKRFIDVTRDLQEAKGTYRLRLRQNITRQVQIADPQATEDDIAEAIENGTAHDLIQRALNRSSLGHQAFQDKADDVAEKSKDIKELEQSMLKLKEMFEELAQLIEMQSEQIDAIEVTIDEAADNVRIGGSSLCSLPVHLSSRVVALLPCLVLWATCSHDCLRVRRLKPATENWKVLLKSKPPSANELPSSSLCSACALWWQ